MADIVLTAALRNNLLSLQNTQKLIDSTQLKLATGLKVNSALDNPTNFFAAKSLNNRAADLTRLLDSLGQSIQTIQAANTGVETLSKLVDQAQSLAQEAQGALSTGAQAAKVTGNVDLRDIEDITAVSGIATGYTLTFSFLDPDATTPGTAVSLDTNFDDGGAGGQVSLDSFESIEEVISQINGLRDSDGNAVIKAELNENGFLELTALTGGDFRIVVADGGGEANAVASALGFGSENVYTREQNDVASAGTAANVTAISVSATPTVNSYAFFDNSTSEVATRSTLLSNIRKVVGGSALITSAATSEIVVTVNGGSVTTGATYVLAATATIQGLVDAINSDTDVNSKIEASFDEDTGVISVKAISATATSVQIGISDDTAATAVTADLGFGVRTLSANSADTTKNYDMESIAFGQSAGQLARIENDFDRLLGQINDLVGDAGYRGVNLLASDDLITYFNEDRSSSLTSVGADLSTAGLGINEANFTSIDSIAAAVEEIRQGQEVVRNFGSTLANDLNVLQARQEFTQSFINTLSEGADKLTLADANEEGANLLALQTRQALGVTSLSLASQSQQSVLRLF